MHTESAISLKTMNIAKFFPFNIFGNCFRQLKFLYIVTIRNTLESLNRFNIDDITNLIEDINFKNKFIEYKQYITARIELSYDTLDKDIKYTYKNKDDYVDICVKMRCIDYIVLNNPNIFIKYIAADVLNNVVALAIFINNIIKENDINNIFQKYFLFYKSKKISAKTFIL
jgi:hypothetical protein